MATGYIWQQHFGKLSTATLNRLHGALDIVLRDSMLEKEYGQAMGLSTIRFFVAQELALRKANKHYKR